MENDKLSQFQIFNAFNLAKFKTNNELNFIPFNSKYSKNLKLFIFCNNLASIFWLFKDIFKFIKLVRFSLNENNFPKK